MSSVSARSAAILHYWFGELDDSSVLDQTVEPFHTYYTRWYGKDLAIDTEIRAAFEPDIRAVARAEEGWQAELARWAAVPNGALGLVLLLDQLPRNMYRGTAEMCDFDALALTATLNAQRVLADAALPVCWRMFLSVPLMHVENVTLQHEAVRQFEALVERANVQSPGQAGFMAYALDYARRHRAVVAEFGRFPHRNAILGRVSTAAEGVYLGREGAGF